MTTELRASEQPQAKPTATVIPLSLRGSWWSQRGFLFFLAPSLVHHQGPLRRRQAQPAFCAPGRKLFIKKRRSHGAPQRAKHAVFDQTTRWDIYTLAPWVKCPVRPARRPLAVLSPPQLSGWLSLSSLCVEECAGFSSGSMGTRRPARWAQRLGPTTVSFRVRHLYTVGLFVYSSGTKH